MIAGKFCSSIVQVSPERDGLKDFNSESAASALAPTTRSNCFLAGSHHYYLELFSRWRPLLLVVLLVLLLPLLGRTVFKPKPDMSLCPPMTNGFPKWECWLPSGIVWKEVSGPMTNGQWFSKMGGWFPSEIVWKEVFGPMTNDQWFSNVGGGEIVWKEVFGPMTNGFPKW